MYAQSTGSIAHALTRLRNHVADVPAQLMAQSETDLIQTSPGKWSKKQVLGHLIDSAINNLKRFTDAQFSDGPYLIQRYNQNGLVAVNYYQTLPLTHLLTLWASLNQQILFVAEVISLTKLAQTVYFGDKPTDDPELTLGWLIEDYVSHLEHHLKTMV